MKIKGTKNSDYLVGTDERDKIKGGKDDDVLVGLGGNDKLRGGKGADTFVLNNQGIDKIKDFNPAEGDVAVIVGGVYTTINDVYVDQPPWPGAGKIFAYASDVDSLPHPADQPLVIYEAPNGHLYYDFDGADGPEVPRYVAKMTPDLDVSYFDFLVI